MMERELALAESCQSASCFFGVLVVVRSRLEGDGGGAYDVFDEFDSSDILRKALGEVGEDSDIEQVEEKLKAACY